ncbi:MAG: HNH endonuclease signature motif containing protein [Patescibacteria group bacterium]|nr:HNH endonuclease signature motif containing protein [Patescibacteria group bacterium]
MSDISPTLRNQVVQRAGSQCEYCRLSQAGQEATFHVDHVVPRTADGPTTADNLALACVSCSLRKGARTTATAHYWEPMHHCSIHDRTFGLSISDGTEWRSCRSLQQHGPRSLHSH